MIRIDPKTTAVVAIDMHRGHLDPSVATLPLPAESCRRVIGAGRELFHTLRHARQPARRNSGPMVQIGDECDAVSVELGGETMHR